MVSFSLEKNKTIIYIRHLEKITNLNNIDMSELLDISLRTFNRIKSNSFRGNFTFDQRNRAYHLHNFFSKISFEQDPKDWLFQKCIAVFLSETTNLQAIKEHGVFAIYILSDLEKRKRSEL